MRRFWTGCLLALLIPYVVTLVWSGSIRGEQKAAVYVSGKRIELDGTQAGYVDAEEYLIGMVGRQIPPDYGAEALKAQAVVARTYIYKKMGDSDEIKESKLGIQYIEESGLEKLWGSEKFVEYYKNIEEAVKATAGAVMMYEDDEIDALFHRASAGMTRAGDEYHPYLEAVESGRDVEAENYLSVMNWSPETFVSKMKELGEDAELTAAQVPESIQMIEKDGAGYVGKIQIGNHIYTGEEVAKALGLSSSCFTFEDYEGQIRSVCKGIGHGYGMSQYGAKLMAADGYTWEDILNYYYKDVSIQQ